MENDIIEVLTDRLRVLMREHNVKAAPLARRAQLNESAVRDILRGRSKNPGIVTLKKISDVLNLRPSALFEAQMGWPVAGVIEGDASVRSVMAEETVPSIVPNPFFLERRDEFEALINNSSVLEPMAFTGDFLIIERAEGRYRESNLGRPCLCRLQDGREVIRVPRMGDTAGKLHLSPVGLYGTPELNVNVASISRIVLTLPQNFVPKLPKTTHDVPTTLHEDVEEFIPAVKSA